jgi:hypothetical protein
MVTMLTMNWSCKALSSWEMWEHTQHHDMSIFLANFRPINTRTRLHRITKSHCYHLRHLPWSRIILRLPAVGSFASGTTIQWSRLVQATIGTEE